MPNDNEARSQAANSLETFRRIAQAQAQAGEHNILTPVICHNKLDRYSYYCYKTVLVILFINWSNLYAGLHFFINLVPSSEETSLFTENYPSWITLHLQMLYRQLVDQ